MHLLPKFARRPKKRLPGQPTVVVFAGGMGTQIIQAAVYFALGAAGEPVWADLSYFDTAPRIAPVGERGKATHWFWQLDPYGLMRDRFATPTKEQRKGSYVLRDGAEMMQLGLAALARQEIQRRFTPVEAASLAMPVLPPNGFMCMHVRRGDYLNVAGHLVPDEEFLALGRKFSGLVANAFMLSDSPFGDAFKADMERFFPAVTWLDGLDPYSSHWLMRQARILVCANSTYSLTAAILNRTGLVIMPKRWFAAKDHAIEAPIHALCEFQMMA